MNTLTQVEGAANWTLDPKSRAHTFGDSQVSKPRSISFSGISDFFAYHDLGPKGDNFGFSFDDWRIELCRHGENWYWTSGKSKPTAVFDMRGSQNELFQQKIFLKLVVNFGCWFKKITKKTENRNQKKNKENSIVNFSRLVSGMIHKFFLQNLEKELKNNKKI